MKVKLKVLQGKSTGMEVKVPVKKFLIGRSEECHMRPKSESVSRQHCALIVKDQKLYVRDLGSRNGTFVNEERVEKHKRLKLGDILRVGKLEFEVIIDHSLGGDKKPKVKDMKDAAARTVNKRGDSGSTSLEFEISEFLEKEDAKERAERYGDAKETRHFEVQRVPAESDEPPEAPVAEDDKKSAGSDTATMKAAESATAEKSKDELEGEGDKKKKGKKEKEKEYGKLPEEARKVKLGANSQDAAAQALKNLFNSR
jgi:pSer/pThr/pTyr-binding forkhead associated (FHA) protein